MITEAEKNGVDSHRVDAEKDARNEESTQHRCNNRHQVVIQLREIFVEIFKTSVEDVIRSDAHRTNNYQPADKQQEICHL